MSRNTFASAVAIGALCGFAAGHLQRKRQQKSHLQDVAIDLPKKFGKSYTNVSLPADFSEPNPPSNLSAKSQELTLGMLPAIELMRSFNRLSDEQLQERYLALGPDQQRYILNNASGRIYEKLAAIKQSDKTAG